MLEEQCCRSRAQLVRMGPSRQQQGRYLCGAAPPWLPAALQSSNKSFSRGASPSLESKYSPQGFIQAQMPPLVASPGM